MLCIHLPSTLHFGMWLTKPIAACSHLSLSCSLSTLSRLSSSVTLLLMPMSCATFPMPGPTGGVRHPTASWTCDVLAISYITLVCACAAPAASAATRAYAGCGARPVDGCCGLQDVSEVVLGLCCHVGHKWRLRALAQVVYSGTCLWRAYGVYQNGWTWTDWRAERLHRLRHGTEHL